jgi:hypothetical protein
MVKKVVVGVVSYGCSGRNVLSKHYALNLNDEEVDHLLNVIESSLESLLGDLVVASRADGAGEGGASHEFTCEFGKSDNCARQLFHV